MTVGESRRFIVLDKDKWLLLNQISDLEVMSSLVQNDIHTEK